MTTSRKPTRSRRQHAAERPSLPPIVAALMAFADLEGPAVPKGFMTAWNGIPAIVARTIAGKHQYLPYDLMNEISGLTRLMKLIEEGRPLPQHDGREDSFGRTLRLLHNDDVDNIADATTPVMSAAFYVGVAYAAYMLTNGGAR